MPGTKFLRILIVDDEEIVHKTLGALLKELGHFINGAWDGISALEIIQSVSYDLALIDVRMPGFDGLTLLSRVRKIKPNMKVVILTGHGDPSMSEEAMEKGALAFLTKPISLLDLMNLLENL